MFRATLRKRSSWAWRPIGGGPDIAVPATDSLGEDKDAATRGEDHLEPLAELGPVALSPRPRCPDQELELEEGLEPGRTTPQSPCLQEQDGWRWPLALMAQTGLNEKPQTERPGPGGTPRASKRTTEWTLERDLPTVPASVQPLSPGGRDPSGSRLRNATLPPTLTNERWNAMAMVVPSGSAPSNVNETMESGTANLEISAATVESGAVTLGSGAWIWT
ncbi:unnamed protein product [Caretta caretta]